MTLAARWGRPGLTVTAAPAGATGKAALACCRPRDRLAAPASGRAASVAGSAIASGWSPTSSRAPVPATAAPSPTPAAGVSKTAADNPSPNIRISATRHRPRHMRKLYLVAVVRPGARPGTDPTRAQGTRRAELGGLRRKLATRTVAQTEQ